MNMEFPWQKFSHFVVSFANSIKLWQSLNANQEFEALINDWIAPTKIDLVLFKDVYWSPPYEEKREEEERKRRHRRPPITICSHTLVHNR